MLSDTDRSYIPMKVNTKKGLSHSLFNWLHHWIIAEFFLGVSLVRTSRGTTSAIQRSWGETDSESVTRCDEQGQERNVVLKSLNLNFRGKQIEKLERERDRERNRERETLRGVS